MRKVLFVWHGYRYFPYEREFAKREVKALLGKTPREVAMGLEVPLTTLRKERLKRLTYFRQAVLPGGRTVVTDQARLEAPAWVNGKARPGTLDQHARSRRQRTRYSAHGLHEYRGKFNPQVVRAIGNILKLPHNAWILDPYCGSGTTLLESTHLGWNAIGIDLNPLAVLISNAKIQAIHAQPSHLQWATERLARGLQRRITGLSYAERWSERQMKLVAGENWRRNLPNFEYLARWFSMPVLAQFAAILKEIDRSVRSPLGSVFRIILSDIVRSVSYQDPGDLRIRRRKDPQENYPAIPMFLQAMEAKIGCILTARKALGRLRGFQGAFVGDSRAPLEWIFKRRGRSKLQAFDAVITSPPYATALPYIDTQRLSLCLLGLVGPGEVRCLERELIGTREISEPRRKKLEEKLRGSAADDMPHSVRKLCEQMLDLTEGPGNGFRRRNMPALCFQYFSDMRDTFRNVRAVVRSGGAFALLVGRNRTVLGGDAVVINTPQLLADVACVSGWRLRVIVELDTYQRFDMHRRNSIKSECLVLLERV